MTLINQCKFAYKEIYCKHKKRLSKSITTNSSIWHNIDKKQSQIDVRLAKGATSNQLIKGNKTSGIVLK